MPVGWHGLLGGFQLFVNNLKIVSNLLYSSVHLRGFICGNHDGNEIPFFYFYDTILRTVMKFYKPIHLLEFFLALNRISTSQKKI